MPRTLCGFILLVAVLLVRPGAQAPAALGALFAEFWKAEDARGAERAAEKIVRSGADFATLYARLQAGRAYSKEKVGDFSTRFAAGHWHAVRQRDRRARQVHA